MSTITQKYIIYLPDASAFYYTADSTQVTADSSFTVDMTYRAFNFISAVLPDTYGYASADSMDITVDDDRITVDWMGNLRPLQYYTIYLPVYVGQSLTADLTTITADSSITTDKTIR